MPRKPQPHKAPSGAPYKAAKAHKSVKLAVSGQVHLLDDASMRQLAQVQPSPSALPCPQNEAPSTRQQQCSMRPILGSSQRRVADLGACLLLSLLAGIQA